MDKAKSSGKDRKRQRLHYIVRHDASGITSIDFSGSASYSIPAKKRSGRPKSEKSEQLIEQIRALKARKKPVWPLAKQYWPQLPSEKARARLYAFVSKNRSAIDRRI